MYWCNYFRDEDENEDIEEVDYLDDEFEEEPVYCPFRQFLISTSPELNYMNRQPGMPPMGGGGMPPMGGSSMPPMGPPPAMIPSKQKSMTKFGPQTQFVDPGSLRPCLFRYVYIWPRRGRGFWAWLTQIGRRSASGFRWNGHRWVYFGIDLREIQSFTCF